MQRYHVFLIGWLLAATVILSIVGLMAKPLPTANADRTKLEFAISRA